MREVPTMTPSADALREKARDLINAAGSHFLSNRKTYVELEDAIYTALIAAKAEGPDWQDMASAPKDLTPVLLLLKEGLGGHEHWPTRQFVARHPGGKWGWNFAAPVGYGGIPDEWIEGWRPLPAPPVASEETRRG